MIPQPGEPALVADFEWVQGVILRAQLRGERGERVWYLDIVRSRYQEMACLLAAHVRDILAW